MDEAVVRSLLQQAAEEKWPFPKRFAALRGRGVERYEVNVLTHEIKFVGGRASFIEAAPAGFTALTLGPKFELDALKTALKRVQSGETEYIGFLGEIAAAGVSFYRVDMKPATVTYHGLGNNKYAEKVPPP